MMMNKKWLTRLLAVVFLLPVLLISGIMTYFTAGDHAENRISPGSNEIRIQEEFEPPEPGKATVKKPVIGNTGIVPCYVRCRILFSDSRAEGYVTLLYEKQEGINTSAWEIREDGWFYGTGELLPGETTGALFDEIYLESDMPEEFKGFTLDVVAESVQTEGFSDPWEAFAAIEAGV